MSVQRSRLRPGAYKKIDSEVRPADDLGGDRMILTIHGKGTIQSLNPGSDLLGTKVILTKKHYRLRANDHGEP